MEHYDLKLKWCTESATIRDHNVHITLVKTTQAYYIFMEAIKQASEEVREWSTTKSKLFIESA